MSLRSFADDIRELENGLFKYENISDPAYVSRIISDKYIERGRSGAVIDKDAVLAEFATCQGDRPIELVPNSLSVTPVMMPNSRDTPVRTQLLVATYISKHIDTGEMVQRFSVWKASMPAGAEDVAYELLAHLAIA